MQNYFEPITPIYSPVTIQQEFNLIIFWHALKGLSRYCPLMLCKNQYRRHLIQEKNATEHIRNFFFIDKYYNKYSIDSEKDGSPYL